jgi:hypothetical protein
MATRNGSEIALSGETASTLAKRLAGRQAARLSLVPGEKKVQGKARMRQGPPQRKAVKPTHHAPGVWYVLKAKRGDDAQMEKVLRAAAEAARRSGTAHALELLGGPAPRTQPVAAEEESEARAPTDHQAHEARRWAETRATFLAEYESVTAPELARLTGSKSANLSARAHSWVKANRIFSVNDGTAERYPLFQLREGQPLPQMAEILPILKRKLSNWQIALWFTAPNAWVGAWRQPIEVLTESPDVVLDAARHEVGEHVL